MNIQSAENNQIFWTFRALTKTLIEIYGSTEMYGLIQDISL